MNTRKHMLVRNWLLALGSSTLAFSSSAVAADSCVPEWDNAISQPGTNPFSYAIWGLTTYNGDLIAGGAFTTAPGGVTAKSIARWDGSSWQQFGAGIDNNGEVLAMAEYNGELVVGGWFTSAGGVPVNRIARWDGSTWQPFGSGLTGGNFGVVHALAVYNGDLIAGGDFTEAGGVTVNHIARWDGSSWHSMADGISEPDDDYLRVLTLAVYNNELIAAGAFFNIGGQAVNDIARWNGTTWQPFDVGGNIGMDGWVHRLMPYNNDLVASGTFETAGGVTCRRVARWDGSAWHPFGGGLQGGSVLSIASHNGELFFGGFISQTFNTEGDFPANGVTSWNIARWDGSSWIGITDACPGSVGNGCGVNDSVEAMIEYNGELVVAGTFTLTGGLATNRIATWRCVGAPCPADMVSNVTFQPPPDGIVDAADLAYLLGEWGVNPGSLADIVNSATFQPPPDGVVDAADLAFLLGAWGSCAEAQMSKSQQVKRSKPEKASRPQGSN
jgi:hypothetical protein